MSILLTEISSLQNSFRNNAIIARMSESDPTGVVDVDTEVGAIGTGEDNTHSGKKGKT